MHHAAHLRGALLAHQPQGVLWRGTGMDHQRFADFAGGTDVAAKAFTLPLQVALEAKVIQAGLTDGDDLLMLC